MTKNEFLKELSKKLHNVDVKERKKIVSYYSELISDMTDDGRSAEEAIKSLGSIDEIVLNSANDGVKEDGKKQGNKIIIIILLILASPVWLPVVCALGGAAIGILVACFAVLLSLVISEIAILLSGIVTVIYSIVALFKSVSVGVFLFGSGLMLLGISVIFAYLIFMLFKVIILGIRKLLKKNK